VEVSLSTVSGQMIIPGIEKLVAEIALPFAFLLKQRGFVPRWVSSLLSIPILLDY